MPYIERLSPDQADCDNNTDIYKEHIKRYKFCLPYIKNKIVLDLACGTGYGAKFMAQNEAKEVWGGDNDSAVITAAKAKYGHSNLQFKAMDAADMPFADNYFDIVVSFETIEHLSDYKKFLSEVKRVLKPGGQLILSTPNRAVAKILDIHNPHHQHEFTREELIDLLKQYFGKIQWFGQRPLSTPTFPQKCLSRLYDIYTRLKFLSFLKNYTPEAAKQTIGRHISRLSRDFEVEPLKTGRQYLYLVVVADKLISNFQFSISKQ